MAESFVKGVDCKVKNKGGSFDLHP